MTSACRLRLGATSMDAKISVPFSSLTATSTAVPLMANRSNPYIRRRTGKAKCQSLKKNCRATSATPKFSRNLTSLGAAGAAPWKDTKKRRMEQVQPDTKERTPSSRVLEDLLHQAPPKRVFHAWLADIKLAAAFVRHRRLVPRPARDNSSGLNGTGRYARCCCTPNDHGSS